MTKNINLKQDLCYFSAEELLFGFEKKIISPVEVVKAIIERIHKFNHIVNAFAYINEEKH